MSRILAPPPMDRGYWRRLLRLVHPDGGGDHDLFVWVTSLREYVAGDTIEPVADERPRRARYRDFAATEGERVPFDEFADHGVLTDRADTTAAELLLGFGHEIPPRPSSWYAKQKRQQKARYALEAAKIRRTQRRIFRWLFAPIVVKFEDEDERRYEIDRAWEEAGRIAFLMVSQSREVA